MRFYLVDRILSLERGKRIVAVKNLSLAEEYLGDHFPTFPVLPGVLMLEGLVQAAGWLVQASADFRYGRTLLREARAVKYGKFVSPGAQLRLEVEALRIEEGESTFKALGLIDGEQAVSARLVLDHYPAESWEGGGGRDPDEVRRLLRQRFALIAAGLNHEERT
jgi:3-hydroxyacyl-[acyl-carrier-protein] dehydratase